MNDTASKTETTDNPNSAADSGNAASAPSTPADAASAQSTTGAAAESADPASEPSAEALLEKARQDAAAAREAHLRAVADLDNFRRRTARERDDLRAFAAANVVEELLPVLDNLGFAMLAADQPNAELKSLAEGVKMVANQLKSALGNHGLKEINPVGQAFDPNQHEALSQQPSETVAEGQVLQVIRVGFQLNGRLLRPASVIVSGGPASAADASHQPADAGA